MTPTGDIETRRLPGSGAGPSPDRMLLGSEGILGVITEAWVRVQDRPTHKASAGVTFADFAAGAEAVRALSQSGLYPTNCRLLDPREAEITGAVVRRAPCSCSASSRPTTRSTRGWTARSSWPPTTAGTVGKRAAATARTRSAPGATRSCALPTCATPSSPAA